MRNIYILLLVCLSLITSAQTKFEKDFFHLTNLVRTNPKSVANLIQKEYENSNGELFGFNTDSIEKVVSILETLPNVDSLIFDSIIYKSMKDNHGELVDNIKIVTKFTFGSNSSREIDTIHIKSVYHDLKFLENHKYGEIIGSFVRWGVPTPLNCLVEFLIDKGNWIDSYKTTTTQRTNGNKSIKHTQDPSVTHKPHFDSIIGSYKKSAVRVSIADDGKTYLFQDFSN